MIGIDYAAASIAFTLPLAPGTGAFANHGELMMKFRTLWRKRLAYGLVAGLGLAGAASAATVEVSITNNQAAGGLFLTPLFTAFHDGTYDSFSLGAAASPGVEDIAEEGDASTEIANHPGLNTNVITSPGGFPGAPVIDPGETATLQINVNRMTERYFSFLSMVIPSNDTFIGNGNPLAHEVFDAAGVFTGLSPILILGANVYDSGTEVNDGSGAAFSGLMDTATDEFGVVGLAGDLGFLLGRPTAAGGTITSVPGATDLFATITISEVPPVPLPAGLPLLMGALVGLGLIRRRAARTN